MQAPPTGARLEPSGFATILSAPPVPYADAPPVPPGEQETQRIAREQGISVAEAEGGMNPDEATREAAMALHRRLQREGGDDYVDVRIVRDPRPRFLFHFRRNGAETLRRFTSDPRFAAADGGTPHRDLEPIMRSWMERFARHRLGGSGGADPFTGIIEIDVGVSRSEFEAIAAREGWTLPPQLRLSFAPETDPESVVSADAAAFVRTFPRADRAPGIILTVAKGGRIILADGCFRLNSVDGPLVLFGRNTRLVRDEQGYLAVVSIANPQVRARIGEHMTWGGYPPAVEEEPGVQAIRRHCGSGPIESVGEPESTAHFRVRPHAIAAYAEAKRIPLQAAWNEIKACWAEQDAALARRRPGDPRPVMRECDYPGEINPAPLPRRSRRN